MIDNRLEDGHWFETQIFGSVWDAPCVPRVGDTFWFEDFRFAIQKVMVRGDGERSWSVVKDITPARRENVSAAAERAFARSAPAGGVDPLTYAQDLQRIYSSIAGLLEKIERQDKTIQELRTSLIAAGVNPLRKIK